MTEEKDDAARAAVMQKQWALRNAASHRHHAKVSKGNVETHTVEAPVDLSVVIAAEKAAQKAEREQSVFIGRYAPKDKDGHSLGKIFNVFAAPQDLTNASGERDSYTYNEAVKRIAELKSWNGFDGTNYATDKELYQAMKDGSYKGGWIIPPRDVLGGLDGDGNNIGFDTISADDTLYANRDKGALKDTFTTERTASSPFTLWYWSSTEDPANPAFILNVSFSNGIKVGNSKDDLHQSCRPVRLEPV